MSRFDFASEAQSILDLPIQHQVNELGGYGPKGEVIYCGHPYGCPSVLTDTVGSAEATFMSTGSVGFHIQSPDGLEVQVLDGSFDNVEKREIQVPSQNVWLDIADGRTRRIASLVNPRVEIQSTPESIRLVKLGDPARAMWFCTTFAFGALRYETAVRYALADTRSGPALTREVMIRNTGRRKLAGSLWGYWNLHGTQRFVYNKETWYDAGIPLSHHETVVTATVPYSDMLQIKRVAGVTRNLKAVAATCDYASFVGDTAATSILPDSVKQGSMPKGGIKNKLNRFASPTIAANQYHLNLAPGKTAVLQQMLLYVSDASLVQRFRKTAGSKIPLYRALATAFKKASHDLVRRTPAPKGVFLSTYAQAQKETHPDFSVSFPEQPVVAEYANSAWTTVEELYENCRAHGARLADGIELGTRDRGQDMWPKMKQDPGRVRQDLVHAMSFLYRTVQRTPSPDKRPLTRREKLHGMFPRQFPSHWRQRQQEVMNDNRPYADSPLWLVDSLIRYLRETGDTSILKERVKSIRLTHPDNPETSGIIGGKEVFSVAEVVREIFACFERHTEDSPYGMAQVMYGDWCDPVDMFGTSRIGDATTRGMGRGSHTRLSAHLFTTLIDTIDAFTAVGNGGLSSTVLTRWKAFASKLRLNVIHWAWEDTGKKGFHAGFINLFHELKADGTKPNYRKKQTGYVLGSMNNRDYDRINRRDLVTQAYALRMLHTNRNYLKPVPQSKEMIQKLLRTVDQVMFNTKIGLALYSTPMANNAHTRTMVGRMGVLPSGCAENGEYHHAQVMMHSFRLDIPHQADRVWKQFMPMLSAMRDTAIAGPFETPCTSYVSDPTDPHFGKAFYFGLSGSIDWIVDIFEKMAGLELGLHDARQPDLAIRPTLPRTLSGHMTYRRIIHCATGKGKFREIPLTVSLKPRGKLTPSVKINGKRKKDAVLASLKGLKQIHVEMQV